MRVRGRRRVMILTADVQMPMRRGLVAVPMRVAVDLSGRDAPEANRAEDDEEQAAEDLPAAFDDERQRPAEGDECAGAEREEEGVADREAHGDTERARALERRRLAGGADRQRRNRHQMIRAQSVEKAQREGRGDEEH